MGVLTIRDGQPGHHWGVGQAVAVVLEMNGDHTCCGPRLTMAFASCAWGARPISGGVEGWSFVVPELHCAAALVVRDFLTWVGVLVQSEPAGSLVRRWVLKGKNRDVEKKNKIMNHIPLYSGNISSLLMLRMPELQLSSSLVRAITSWYHASNTPPRHHLPKAPMYQESEIMHPSRLSASEDLDKGAIAAIVNIAKL